MTAASGYEAHLVSDFAQAEPLLAQLAERQTARVPFQDVRWLSLWYEHFARIGIETLVVIITRRGCEPVLENVAMALPLMRRRKYFLPIVEFADRGVTDYNLPFEGPCCPTNADDMWGLVEVLQKAVRPYALLRLSKMPLEARGRANLFAMHCDTQASGLEGHWMTLPKGDVDMLKVFPKKKRSEIGRAGRSLDTMGEHRFSMAETPEERARVLRMICEAQRIRVPEKNERYFLEDAGYREFYDALAFDPAAAGLTVMSAVWLNGRPVAGLMGVRDGNRYVALRIAVETTPEIMRLGLGKLVLFRTAEWAQNEGIETFDFSLGGNALKAWFHPEPFALIQYTSVLNGIRLPKWFLGLLPSHRLAGHGETEALPGGA